MARTKQTAHKAQVPRKTCFAAKGKGKGKSVSVSDVPRKKHRFRSGTVALRDIRKAQRGTELLIKKLPFQRLVREIASDLSGTKDVRFAGQSIVCLQQASETYMIGLLGDALVETIHANRQTVQVKDLKTARKLRA